MSSRFVSGGTNEEPTERDEAWLAAQKEIDAKRLQEKQKLRPGEQEGGKSLYETLQANKAAKQDAFEESIRLRNQFRSLDEDEVEFLDSVLESTRAKEAEVRKETSEQLDAFREQQRQVESSATQQDAEPAGDGGGESWAAGPRKRKKGRESGIGGVKLRRVSTSEKQMASSADAADIEKGKPVETSTAEVSKQETKSAQGSSNRLLDATTASASTKGAVASPKTEAPPKIDKPTTTPSPPPVGLGLAAYSSDEDDRD